MGDSGIEGKSNLRIEGLRNSGIKNGINAHNDPNLYSEILERDERSGFHRDVPKSTNQPIHQSTNNGFLKAFFTPPQFIVAVLILLATYAISQGVEFREKIPLAKSFDSFPVDVGGWSGRRDVMEQMYIDSLDLSDYVIVDYTNGSGKNVNFYTAYYTSQLKGESIHSPATCLPGSGWEFKQAGTTTIPVAANGRDSMPVNRAFMEKSGVRELSYYWFPQRGRILTNAYQLKLFNFWDALTRQRTDGALVRLITPVYENEEVADAERRLISFTKVIVPVLNEYLPE